MKHDEYIPLETYLANISSAMDKCLVAGEREPTGDIAVGKELAAQARKKLVEVERLLREIKTLLMFAGKLAK